MDIFKEPKMFHRSVSLIFIIALGIMITCHFTKAGGLAPSVIPVKGLAAFMDSYSTIFELKSNSVINKICKINVWEKSLSNYLIDGHYRLFDKNSGRIKLSPGSPFEEQQPVTCIRKTSALWRWIKRFLLKLLAEMDTL